VADRSVRAQFDYDSIIVYRAYGNDIAQAALSAQTFVAPFRLERMTWIKPSFLWMMYRSGWATKAGQERVLAIRCRRDGFDWALAHAALSAFDPALHESEDAWRTSLRESPVRVQWDPDRDVRLNPMTRRAIQIGLTGAGEHRYVKEWILEITDVTPAVRDIHELVGHGDLETLLPVESDYPVEQSVADRLGM
jgi:hypothetical protein